MGPGGEPRRDRARRLRQAEDRALSFLRFLASLLLALALPAAPALAQTAQEHEVKAAFLFKFPTFVEWPEGAPAPGPFVIGIYGAAEIAGELRRLVQGRSVNGRPVEVRRLAAGDPLGTVHMVFVGSAEAARLPAVAKAAQAQPILVVTDWAGALEQGSMINFVPSQGRVRFEIALDAAERSRLRISSRMLAVAQNVRPPKP